MGWALPRALLVALPAAVPLFVTLGLMPRGLAFALTAGWWLIALGAVATLVALTRSPEVKGAVSLASARRALGAWSARRTRWTVWAAAFLIFLALIPGYRWYGLPSGDEPKYLRMARSLWLDLDADVSGGRTAAPGARGLATNVGRLGAATWSSAADLVRGERPPVDHRWSLGNWTVAGWHGGSYHVQSPGLPLLLAPAMALAGEVAEGPPSAGALITLAVLWSLTLTQAFALATEVTADRLSSALATLALAVSPSVFVGGYHFYPEVAAAPALVWSFRFIRPGGPRPTWASLLGLALVAACLPWLHVKFVPLSLTCLGLLALRERRQPLRLAVASLVAALPWAFLLLYQYRVTGLLRPDGLYLRFGDEVHPGLAGFVSERWFSGLAAGLFSARDGLFVMAPAAVVAALSWPRLWREHRSTGIALLAVLASLWAVAAVHGGAAPGPPGRLMAPVVLLLAIPLAAGLGGLRRSRPLRWSYWGALLLALSLTAGLHADWRRTVKPWRQLLSAETDLVRDLPAPPGRPPEPWRDTAKAAVLGGVVLFWARRLSVPSPGAPASPPAVWRELGGFHLGVWGSLVLAALALGVIEGSR